MGIGLGLPGVPGETVGQPEQPQRQGLIAAEMPGDGRRYLKAVVPIVQIQVVIELLGSETGKALESFTQVVLLVDETVDGGDLAVG